MLNYNYPKILLTMSVEEKNDKNDINNERKKLNELGVGSTWNILTDLTKKKKEE